MNREPHENFERCVRRWSVKRNFCAHSSRHLSRLSTTGDGCRAGEVERGHRPAPSPPPPSIFLSGIHVVLRSAGTLPRSEMVFLSTHTVAVQYVKGKTGGEGM